LSLVQHWWENTSTREGTSFTAVQIVELPFPVAQSLVQGLKAVFDKVSVELSSSGSKGNLVLMNKKFGCFTCFLNN